MRNQKIQIRYLDAKIKAAKHRLKLFSQWAAPKHLKNNKKDCMIALRNNLDFFEEFKKTGITVLALRRNE